MELHFIRHTPVDLESGICYGQSDVDLNSEFPKYIQILKSKINEDYDSVICSPLQRCTKVTNALGFKNYATDERIKEINFGDWELQNWNNIDRKSIDEWSKNLVNYRIPNGESLEDLYKRVKDFYDEITSRDYERILVVTHAGVIRCIWSLILEIPLQNVMKIPVGFGENFIVDTTFHTIKQKG